MAIPPNFNFPYFSMKNNPLFVKNISFKNNQNSEQKFLHQIDLHVNKD